MDKITDEILLEYLDGTISTKEAEYIKEFLESNDDLKSRLAELKLADQILLGEIETPSASFTDTVWNKISGSTGTVHKFNLNTFLIIIGAMITVVLGSYFITDSIIDLDLGFNITDSVTDYVKVPVVEVPEDVNLKVVNQVLLYSISFLILLVLDKAVLRPYFKRRRELLTGV